MGEWNIEDSYSATVKDLWIANARIAELEVAMSLSQKLCGIYFDIAVTAIGEDQVRERRDKIIAQLNAQ